MAVTKRLCPFFLQRNTALSGYVVYTKITNTTTNKTSYKDAEGNASHTQPIILDSSGLPPTGAIWLDTDSAYRIVLKDPTESTTYFTQDYVNGILDPSVASYTSKNIKFADGEGMADANGNEVITVQKTTSAVNQLNVKNSATGNAVLVETAGSDSNIDLQLKAKGTTGDVLFTSRGNDFILPTSAPTVGQLLYASSPTQLDWHNGTGYFQGQSYGFTMSNAADTDHDITIAAGSKRDSSDTVTIVSASSTTKRIDAGWAAGTNQGGLASGVALANDTWYHVFKIQKSDGTIDAGFDSSLTAVNLLADSGYSYYAYVGSVLTDASANILQFTQVGNMFIWKTPTLDISTTSLSTTSTQFPLPVPPGVSSEASLNLTLTNASAANIVIRNSGQTDSAPSTSAAPLGDLYCAAGVISQAVVPVVTDTSKSIYIRASAASTTVRGSVRYYANLGL